jgi:hypothetical protein
MKSKHELIAEGPPIFDDRWDWSTDQYPKPGSFDACCVQCADYRVPGKGGKPVSPLFDTIMDCCVSEEIMKCNGERVFDHGLLLNATMQTGCKFLRRKKSLEETLFCINNPEKKI